MPRWFAIGGLGVTLTLAITGHGVAQDLADLQEAAIKEAVRRVAPSIVQVETSGGSDILTSDPNSAPLRKGTAPTTGLIVAADGYIISSAFNFANRPSEVFIAVPGQKERYVAHVVSTDHTRLLTLLKIEATGLSVPQTAPKRTLKVGQTAIAVGRTWGGPDDPPSISLGIVSALNRIWGKAVQTDAKVSPVNYGGPLVDLEGRVIGVLVPASPQNQDEKAGVEWYDSGIGFAIPWEDVIKVLPRLRQGSDLQRGMLGIVPKSADIYGSLAVVGHVQSGSAAAQAGIRDGDVITDVAGAPVERYAQLMQALGDKYEGDVVAVRIRRGAELKVFPTVRLTGPGRGSAQAFLGILPVRDNPEPGVTVRYVYPKSAAEAAGLKVGDRILGVGFGTDPPRPVPGRDALLTAFASLATGTELRLDVRPAGASRSVLKTVRLSESLSDAGSPAVGGASRNKARERLGDPAVDPAARAAEAKPTTGLVKRALASLDHEFWLYVPTNYDPNVAHAPMVWLHAAGKGGEKDMQELALFWKPYCERFHLILVAPRAQNEAGWLASETDVVREALQEAALSYTLDLQRAVVHGAAGGGPMAYYLGFHAANVFHGVAAVNAVPNASPPERSTGQRLSFFLVAGSHEPARASMAQVRDVLRSKKYPVVYRDSAASYLDAETLEELSRWIDCLDRF